MGCSQLFPPEHSSQVTEGERTKRSEHRTRAYNHKSRATYVEIDVLRWRARAWDLDRFSVGTVHSAITITAPSWVDAGLESQRGSETLDCGSIQSSATIPVASVAWRRGGSGSWGRSWLVFDRRVGRGGNVSSSIDRLLLQREGGRNDRASLPRTVQVLKRDGSSIQPRRFVGLGVTSWEGQSHRRIVESLSGLNVRDQLLKKNHSVLE